MTGRKYLGILLITLVFISCKDGKVEKPPMEMEQVTTLIYPNDIDLKAFEGIVEGDSVKAYTLVNQNGIKAVFTNYGQRLIALYTPDKNGEMADVVLGFPTLEQYLTSKEKYFGAVIGRYGNRIAKGTFTIGDTTYTLVKNNGGNHLHGGTKGFESKVWQTEQIGDSILIFTRTSPHMEEGYPGNLNVKVKYTLSSENALKIQYKATTDQSTVVNLTHHSYFNLKGEGKGDINDHILYINAERFTPVNEDLIPKGTMESVSNTPMDFTTAKTIGRDLEEDYEQLLFGRGYDHNYVLNHPEGEAGVILAAQVWEPVSGRTMEVYTDEPGVQFYGGNFMDGTTTGKSGMSYLKRGAFCLETQHFPNSPNEPNFPSTLLNPGEVYTSTCIYKFDLDLNKLN